MAPGGGFLAGLLGLEDPAKGTGRRRRETRYDYPAYTLSPKSPQTRIDRSTGDLIIDDRTTHIPFFHGHIPDGRKPPSERTQAIVAAHINGGRAFQAASHYFQRRDDFSPGVLPLSIEEHRRSTHRKDRARMDVERNIDNFSDAETKGCFQENFAQLSVFFNREYPHIVCYLPEMSTPQKRELLKIWQREIIKRRRMKRPEKKRKNDQGHDDNDKSDDNNDGAKDDDNGNDEDDNDNGNDNDNDSDNNKGNDNDNEFGDDDLKKAPHWPTPTPTECSYPMPLGMDEERAQAGCVYPRRRLYADGDPGYGYWGG